MFTCCIRYVVDLDKLAEFKEYAVAWIALIQKYGGTHHGYFMPGGPGDVFPDATFSFPGLGTSGPPNVGYALFSFASVEAYEAYRKDVSDDPGCRAATARFNETRCFSSYERHFLKPVHA
jgi:hypothetical protein